MERVWLKSSLRLHKLGDEKCSKEHQRQVRSLFLTDRDSDPYPFAEPEGMQEDDRMLEDEEDDSLGEELKCSSSYHGFYEESDDAFSEELRELIERLYCSSPNKKRARGQSRDSIY